MTTSTLPRRSTRLLQLLAVLVVGGYVVWTLPGVRPTPGFVVPFDAGLQGGGYVLAAVLAVLGARRAASRTWWWVAAAVGLRALGFVIALGMLSTGSVLPYPSLADAAWFLSSLVLIGGLVLRLRELAPRLPALVVLDAVAVSLLAVGLVLSILAGPLRTLTAPSTPRSAVLVNLGYPVLDTALLVAALALATVVPRLLRPADRLVLGGVVAFVAVDTTYFVLLASGQWRPGTLLASLSLVATSMIAYAVHVAPPGPAPGAPRVLGERPRTTRAPSLLVCAGLAGTAVVALVAAGLTGATSAAVAAFGAAGGVAVGRGAFTLRSERREAGVVLGVVEQDVRRLEALVEASNNVIGMADVEGRMLYLNPSAREMLALPLGQDVTELHVADLAPGEGASAFTVRWPQLLAEGSWEGESTLHPRDGGEPVPVAASTFVIRNDETGEPIAVGTIQTDIRQQRQQAETLRLVAEQRSRLLTRLVQAQDDERAQIAADVHDDSVQALAVVDLRLGVLRRRLEASSPDLLESIDALQASVSTATDRLRHLLFDLESPARRTGLADALAHAARGVFAPTDIAWDVVGALDVDLPQAERVTAYRVAKEAMANARQHAGASRVQVELVREEGVTVVSVRDDGRGIDPGDDRERPGHRGLASMRDRALVAGGRLVVRPVPDGGTEVRLELPGH